jgi:hypothetical protein
VAEPRVLYNRLRLRDDLRAAIGLAADLELPDWPTLADLVEAGIGKLQQALAMVEGDETRAEHAAYLADLRHADGHAPTNRTRLPDWTVLLENRRPRTRADERADAE